MAAPSEHGHGTAEHLSRTPILLGVGILLLYSTMAYPGLLTLVGVVAFAIPLTLWVREDVRYWREGRMDHGVLPGRDVDWWGMIFFLGTEVMLFASLFAAFFVGRAQHADVWSEARTHLSHALPLVTVNTLILVTSGGFCHYALVALRKNKRGAFLGGLAVTILLGLTFLVIQVNEYRQLMDAGITLSASPFGAIFYVLTGTHAFHVFFGLVLLATVFVRGKMGQFDAKRHVAVDAFAIYWHFVDVVWIILYLIVYVGVV